MLIFTKSHFIITLSEDKSSKPATLQSAQKVKSRQISTTVTLATSWTATRTQTNHTISRHVSVTCSLHPANPEISCLESSSQSSCNLHFCFRSHFSPVEMKNLRLFVRTQQVYFSQILFTNVFKSVLVSISPLPRQSIHLTGVAYQDAD